jgi:acetoin utilization deacetylase AcuC-like enzyme
VRLYYSDRYLLAGYAFDTTRKAAWIVESLEREPVAGVVIHEPQDVSLDDLNWVHDARYTTAVRIGEPRELATSMGFPWDPGLWPMVLASNGGVVEATRAALLDGVAGSLSSGLHHARRDHGAGFCTFNGLALAAWTAHRLGAKTVLILDLDAHCGGGTHAITRDLAWVIHVDVSVNGFDRYDSTPHQTLSIVSESTRYLGVIQEQLNRIGERETVDLCIYNAGMDPHESSAIGGLSGISTAILEERERMVFSWCRGRQIPIVFVMAGGYTGKDLDRVGLAALHRLTIEQAIAGG